jgi:hypothetical protein
MSSEQQQRKAQGTPCDDDDREESEERMPVEIDGEEEEVEQPPLQSKSSSSPKAAMKFPRAASSSAMFLPHSVITPIGLTSVGHQRTVSSPTQPTTTTAPWPLSPTPGGSLPTARPLSPLTAKAPVPYTEFIEIKKLLQIEREERDALQARVKELEAALEAAKGSARQQFATVKGALEARIAEQDGTIRDLRAELDEARDYQPKTGRSSMGSEIKMASLVDENIRLGEQMADIKRKREPRTPPPALARTYTLVLTDPLSPFPNLQCTLSLLSSPILYHELESPHCELLLITVTVPCHFTHH